MPLTFKIIKAYPVMKMVCSDVYINHKCKEVGCFKRAIVIDGNQKNHRKVKIYNDRIKKNNKFADL